MCIYVQPAALNQSKPYADAGLNLPLLPHTHTHTHTHTHSPADDSLLIATQGARLGAELTKSLNL